MTNYDEQTNEVACLTEFDSIYKSIENRKYNVINDFYQASVKTIGKISHMVETTGFIDISRGIVPDASTLLPLFEKVSNKKLISVFSKRPVSKNMC